MSGREKEGQKDNSICFRVLSPQTLKCLQMRHFTSHLLIVEKLTLAPSLSVTRGNGRESNVGGDQLNPVIKIHPLPSAEGHLGGQMSG